MNSIKEREPRARLAITVGLLVTFGGLAIAGTGSKLLGGPIVAVGWAALLYGIHAFGRLGRSEEG